MPNQISAKQIKEYFFHINRTLTIGLVLILVFVSAMFWLLGVSMQNISTWVGITLMLLAVVFYQIPRFSYQLTKKHFHNQGEFSDDVLNSGWEKFKKWLEIQSSS